jgi:hypothetical protein
MSDYGIKTFRQLQLNRESAIGTPGASWFNWRGLGLLDDQRVGVFPEEDIGIFGGTDRQYFPQLRGELNMPSHAATFELIGHILDAGIARATPAADGGGTGFIRTYTMPIVAADAVDADDLQTYHVKQGDNVAVDITGGAFVKSFALEGTQNEPWMLSATWETQEVADDGVGFVEATVPLVEEMMFNLSTIFIDDDDAAHGYTQAEVVLTNATLNIETGWQALFTADGSLAYSNIKQRAPEIMLNVTLEMTAAVAAAERENWRTSVPRLIRLVLEGSELTTEGTDYANKTLIIDLAGKWDKFDPLGDDDGDDIVTAQFRCRYNEESASFFEMVLVNEVATL